MTPTLAFYSLPPERFPFTIELIGQRTLRVHHSIHVTKPAGLASVRIPSAGHLDEPWVMVSWYPGLLPVVTWPDCEPCEDVTTPIYDYLVKRMRDAETGRP